MTIDNLKCFVLVAENLSFARAAETLYISQPAVTKQINSLETELGTSLFIRSTRHVELTPAGMSFYKDAKEIVTKSQIAVQRLQSQNNETDSFGIGLSNPTILPYLAPVLQDYHMSCPEIRPNIEVLSYKIILNLFMEKKLDILFFYKDNLTSKAGISFKELVKDHLMCLTSKEHPFAVWKAISICDLKNQKIIACNPLNAPVSTSAFQQKLLNQFAFESIFYCNTIEIAHCMVAANMGIAVLPSLLCPASEKYCKIPIESTKDIPFGVFYHKSNHQNSLENFLQILSKRKFANIDAALPG